MKKIILSLSILFLITGNVFSAGSSGGDNESTKTKSNYEKAVTHIEAAKKHEKKGKLEKANKRIKRFLELWCLSIATFFSGFLSFYFIKMLIISIDFKERSEGADEIYIWIPQTTVAIGSTIFFICVLHNFILLILKRKSI